MLQIHNSMTGRKEALKPLVAGSVGMYVCGITVYDYCHLGHARMLIAFDVARRYLQSLGYAVNFVRNITDIDDKIIRRAQENGETTAQLTERFITAMNEDCAALGVTRPDHEPRATEYLPAIIAMVEKLVERGYAYAAANGDVYYSIAKFPAYGRLSGKRIEDLRAGERVEVDEAKRDPLDFVLWKAAKSGEPAWESPWGSGRPGWHIECSAMSTQILGPHFDIHGGGLDLKFPHHENEIAQSCAACNAPFANLWMHNGFVRIDEEKMSKSLGNFFTVREVLKRYHGDVIRYFMLASHYRGPINYSDENLEQAKAGLTRLALALRPFGAVSAAKDPESLVRFRHAMDDDFNTSEALAVLQSLATEINTEVAAGKREHAAAKAAELKTLAAILGLLADPESVLKFSAKITPGVAGLSVGEKAPSAGVAGTNDGADAGTGAATSSAALSDAQIDERVTARVAARKSKDFKESDRIRDELLAQNILLEDGPQGTAWRRK